MRITDSCGAISKAADASGDLAFGTSAGTDCTTPGAGGAGNTHAARTQFYDVNRAKEIGRGWLPSNTWLNAKLTANVNLNQTCNAYWNGSTINFFRSGGGCANTGELPGVSLHEWGHGLDSQRRQRLLGRQRHRRDLRRLHRRARHPHLLHRQRLPGLATAAATATPARPAPASATSTGPSTPATRLDGLQLHPDHAAPALAEQSELHGPLRPGRPLRVVRLLRSAVGPRHPRPAEPRLGLRLGDRRPPLVPVALDGHQGLHLHGVGHLDVERLLHRLVLPHHARGGRRQRQPGRRHAARRRPRRGVQPPRHRLHHRRRLEHDLRRLHAAGRSGAHGHRRATTRRRCPGAARRASTTSTATRPAATPASSRSPTTSRRPPTPTTRSPTASPTTTRWSAQPSGNEAAASAPSTCLSVTPAGAPCTPPAAPTGRLGHAPSRPRRSTSPGRASAGATSYTILRSTTSGGPYTAVGTSATTSFSEHRPHLQHHLLLRRLGLERHLQLRQLDAGARPSTAACTGNVLTNGVPVTGISGATGSQQFWTHGGARRAPPT